MPIDKVLMRFAGAAAQDQTQSMPGLPMSTAAASKHDRCILDMGGVTGDYPIPGVSLLGIDYGDESWVGYMDLSVTVTVTANHGLSQYRVGMQLHSPTSPTPKLGYAMGSDFVFPPGLDPSIPCILCITDSGTGNVVVRLEVEFAALASGASTVYQFYVPAIRVDGTTEFVAHSGGYLSEYVSAPWFPPSGGTYRRGLALFDEILQCVRISLYSDILPTDILMRPTSSAAIAIILTGNQGPYSEVSSPAGSLSLTGGNRHISVETNEGVFTFYLDVEKARRTFIALTSGTIARIDEFSSGGWFYIRPSLRTKNALFPATYKNNMTRRAYYLQNITATPVTVSMALNAIAASSYIYLERVAPAPDLYWVLGDGVVTGIPASAVNADILSATAMGSVEIPPGGVAGMVLRFQTDLSASAESVTELLVFAP